MPGPIGRPSGRATGRRSPPPSRPPPAGPGRAGAPGPAVRELEEPRRAVGPVHGTGCTLSAAIAAELACGRPLLDAVRSARAFVRGAIGGSWALGAGSRVLDHRR